MHFRQFHLPQLGHASYLIGDATAGVAIVVDPQVDVQPYVDAAAEAGLRITHVLDTHSHSDYRSGRATLAAATGATVLVSAYGAPAQDGQVAVSHDEVIEIGDVWLRVLHVPGHAPEQLVLLVGEGAQDGVPQLVLSSGSLMCGDVGRPDIDESIPVEVAAPATVARIREQLMTLPDHVRVYPTHVAGSLCSAAADGATQTTIGHERRANAWLQPDADLAAELARLPRKPAFWSTLRQTNATAMPVVEVPRTLVQLTPAEALAAQEEGALLLDVRDAEAYAAGHPAGTVHLGTSAAAPVLAGALLAPGARTVVVADDAASALRLAHDLQRVGVAAPLAWVQPDLAAWRDAAATIATVPTPTADELVAAGRDLRVLDVRQPAEWATGTVAGALLVSLPDLPELGRDLPDEPLVVACAAGKRSITAVSMLRHLGREGDVSVAGGVGEWARARSTPLAVH